MTLSLMTEWRPVCQLILNLTCCCIGLDEENISLKRKTRSCSLLSLLWMPRTVIFSYFSSPSFQIFWCWLEFMGSVVSFWANVSVTFLLYNTTVSAAPAGWLSTSHCFQFWNTQGIRKYNTFPWRIVSAFQDTWDMASQQSRLESE